MRRVELHFHFPIPRARSMATAALDDRQLIVFIQGLVLPHLRFCRVLVIRFHAYQINERGRHRFIYLISMKSWMSGERRLATPQFLTEFRGAGKSIQKRSIQLELNSIFYSQSIRSFEFSRIPITVEP